MKKLFENWRKHVNEASVPNQATPAAAKAIQNQMHGSDPIRNVRQFLVKNKTEDNITAAIEAFRPYADGSGDEYDKFIEELTVALQIYKKDRY